MSKHPHDLADAKQSGSPKLCTDFILSLEPASPAEVEPTQPDAKHNCREWQDRGQQDPPSSRNPQVIPFVVEERRAHDR